jgi:outer membrane lipoprotein-sorting protein
VVVPAALLLFALAAAPAGAAPDAQTLLARAAARYADGSAHVAEFTQVYTPGGFATSRRESGRVWIQAPRRLRFDYTAPEKKVFTYDAGEGRFLLPEERQLTIRKLSPEEQAKLPIVFLERPEELSSRYSLERDASGAVLLKPRASSDLAWLTLVISPTGAVEGLSYEDTSGNRTEFRFAAWKAEKPRPHEDYRVVGPKGTRIVGD